MFERLVPAVTDFAHDDFESRTVNLTPGERRNGRAHCRAALLRTSESFLVADAEAEPGRWQRVLLVDFDGGQRRESRSRYRACSARDDVRSLSPSHISSALSRGSQKSARVA